MNGLTQNAATGLLTSARLAENRVRIVLLVVLVFLLGLGAGAVWFRRAASVEQMPVSGSGRACALSPATVTLLQNLTSSVEIRFYSVLRETQAAAERQAFAARVTELLGEYQQAGGDKIIIKRIQGGERPDAASTAAVDGLTPIRGSRSEPDFLGLVIRCGDRKAVIPKLSAHWEEALEFDLSRAIARVTDKTAAGELTASPAPADAAALEEIKRALPNLAAMTLPEATIALHNAARAEFKQAVEKMQKQTQAAQEKLTQAQAGRSQEAQLAARRDLQQLQMNQAEAMSQIARRLDARLAAVAELKSNNE